MTSIQENSKKKEIQRNVNNYIESQRLFLTEPLYKNIKSVQKSMNLLSAIYETTPHIEGSSIDFYNQKSQRLEKNIKQQLTDLETSFVSIMFEK